MFCLKVLRRMISRFHNLWHRLGGLGSDLQREKMTFDPVFRLGAFCCRAINGSHGFCDYGNNGFLFRSADELRLV